MTASLRMPALLRPSIAFAATATAGGVVATFLPAAAPGASGTLLAGALLAHAGATTVSRWWAGRFGDRHGSGRLLTPGVLLTGAGMLLLVLVADPVALFAAMVLVGAGFGVVQNVTLAVMLERVPPSGFGTVSALWSVAYDAGYGLGAAGVGLLAVSTGYPAAFALNGLMVLAVLVATRGRRR